MTRTSIVWGKGILGDITEYSSVTPEVCWEAVRNRTHLWNNWMKQRLVEVASNFWSTNNTLQVEYKWCCYDVANSVENFFLEIGEVASIDGQRLVTDLQDLSSCRPTSGNCQDREHGSTVWNGKVFKDECAYLFHGTYKAKISGMAVVIPEIQGAFSYSGNAYPPDSDCVPEDAFYTDQGAVFLRFVNGSVPRQWLVKAKKEHESLKKPDKEHEDLKSYRRFYMYRKILEVERQQFGLLWQQLCLIRQSQLDQIWQWLRINPTMGIRALLGKDGLHAEWAGEALMFWECRNVTPAVIHESGKVNGTCYKYTPIQIISGGQLWFVIPGSRDLIDHSPVEDCSHTTPHIFKDEKGRWHSVHGPIQVTDLPLEMVWKGLWSAFTFSAPSLFMNLPSRLPAFPEIQTQFQRLQKIEAVMHRLINYTAEMSLDPAVIHNTITGIGMGIGKVLEGSGKALGHTISGVASGIGSLFNKLLKGPLQLLLNVVIIGAVVIGIVFIFVKFLPWRIFTHRRNRSSEEEPDEEEEQDGEGEEMKEDLLSQQETMNTEYQLHFT